MLDILRIPVLEHQPQGYQCENWLLDPASYWTKVERLPREDLSRLLDPPAPLWIDGHSSYSGRNDRIPLDTAAQIEGSLRFIRVPELQLKIFAPGEAFGNTKRRVQGIFVHSGSTYALWVTDPGFERKYLALDDNTYRIGAAHLTISLGEPYRDHCYKLIAAILPAGGRTRS